MSLRRILRLAGLNESISQNPETNAEIEARLRMEPVAMQGVWSDILDIIRAGRGKGLSPSHIAHQLRELYITDHEVEELIDNGGFAKMIKSLRTDPVFGKLITFDDKGWMHWNEDDANDDLGDIDPRVHQAIGAQVDMTYTAMEIMRDLTAQYGSFTEQDLARALANHTHHPMSRELANHILGQFQSMLVRQGNRYSIKPETNRSTDDNMQMLRDLSSQKPAGDQKYEVLHDGELKFVGSHDECFTYILRHQSQSVDWAMKYEGWEIVPNV